MGKIIRIALFLWSAAPTIQATADELLPVELFAASPAISAVRLSPDGANVAYLAAVDTPEVRGTAIRVHNIDSGASTSLQFVPADDADILWLRWANNDQLLMKLADPGPDIYRNTRLDSQLVVVTVETGEPRKVIVPIYTWLNDREPPSDYFLEDILPDDPDHILIKGYLDDRLGLDVYKVGLSKTDVSRVSSGVEGIIDWITDRQHRPRIAIRRNDSVYTVRHRYPEAKKWSDLWEFESFTEEEVWPMGFGVDPDLLYVMAYQDDRRALFKVKLSDPGLQKELVFADPRYDIDGSLVYSKSGKAIGIRYSGTDGIAFWDDEFKALQAGLDNALPEADNLIYSFSDNERRYIAFSSNDTNPGTYYLGDRDEKKITPLAQSHPGFPVNRMAEKVAIEYKARDGLVIEGFLTLPEKGKDGPVPAIVFPLRGDFGGRSTDSFDPWTQLFASRGYAVLEMNFRGSRGFGYDFLEAGLQSWGLDMQNDVEDGTRWLIDEGIADPDRICVVGASFGGYIALMEVVRSSELYRCVVSMAGITDLPLLVSTYRHSSSYETVRKLVGTRRSEMQDRSPRHNAESIGVPVLLAHGTDDRTVRVEHSRRMHDELKAADKDVTYIEFEDGDHLLSEEDHRLEFLKSMDAFLQEHL